MPESSHITDHSDRAVARAGWDDLARLRAFVRSWVDAAQQLEDATFALKAQLALSSATGVWLDKIGARVGQAREGYTDAVYRLWIAARVLINRSSGTGPQLYAIADALLPGVRMRLRDTYPAAFTFEALDPVDLATGTAFAELVRQARIGGVNGQFVWGAYPLDESFSASDTTPEQPSTQGVNAYLSHVSLGVESPPVEPVQVETAPGAIKLRLTSDRYEPNLGWWDFSGPFSSRLVQSNGAQRPTVVRGADEVPVVTFSGGQLIKGQTNTLWSAYAFPTVVVVMEAPAGASGSVVVDSNVSTVRSLSIDMSGGNVRAYFWAQDFSTITLSAPYGSGRHVVRASFTGGAVELAIDGIVVDSQPLAPGVGVRTYCSGVCLGADWNGANPFTGGICDVVVGEFSGAEAVAVDAVLAKLYATVAPPDPYTIFGSSLIAEFFSAPAGLVDAVQPVTCTPAGAAVYSASGAPGGPFWSVQPTGVLSSPTFGVGDVVTRPALLVVARIPSQPLAAVVQLRLQRSGVNSFFWLYATDTGELRAEFKVGSTSHVVTLAGASTGWAAVLCEDTPGGVQITQIGADFTLVSGPAGGVSTQDTSPLELAKIIFPAPNYTKTLDAAYSIVLADQMSSAQRAQLLDWLGATFGLRGQP